MLADEEHGIDREFAGAERQGVGDGGTEPDAVPLGLGATEVRVVGHLLDEQAGDLEIGPAICSMNRLAISKSGLCRPCPSWTTNPSRKRPTMW
jgi:hypothetical protein